jgi:beta-glucosidase
MKLLYSLGLTFLLANSLFSQTLPYLNNQLSISERSADLVSRLTLEEKAQQMMNATPAIDRLNIPPYDYWNEALHGVGRAGEATVFPQAIGLAATFDTELVNNVASVISDEARANYNITSAKGYYNRYNGLTFWTPNINIFRDPRWGRGQETYGEDPFLTAQMGVAFVTGLQGTDPKYLKTAACAKHFAVHSGPERLRHEFNAQVTPKDLNETYLPAFKALIDANVESVMCAYNRTNDEPCCANNTLLNEILRDKWGFKGHVVSDCDAISDFYQKQGHGTVKTEAEAAALAVKNGVNLDCGSEYKSLMEAVSLGLIDEKTIDAALAKLLETRFKLGMFDTPESNPYSKLGKKDINSEASRALARDVARKSIVLLKNNGVLPLRNDLSKYYVTGPNATNIEPLIGNYYGVNSNMVTMLEGILKAVEAGSQVYYRQGTLLDRDNVNPIDWATGHAKNSDATFLIMGITGNIEGEEGASIASPSFGDRLDYDIPKNQIDYLRKLKTGTDRPVIAIVTGGSPMNLAEVHEIADAVLLVWYPGEEGGNAVADILFGKVSPSGRLPVTFPQSLDQLPAYEDYTMKGRTYKYMTATPLYPFGFGLSYVPFVYSEIMASSDKIKKGQVVKVETTITNKGNMDATEVVQLYISDVKASSEVPIYSLKNFQRIYLKQGETQKVSFEITTEMLEYIDQNGQSKLESGDFKIYIGGSLPDARSKVLGASPVQSKTLTLK